MLQVAIDCDQICDWYSFHRVFKEAFGFPEYYGCNMDAWIDCMSYLDDASSGMTKFVVERDGLVVIQLENFTSFQQRLPEQCAALIDAVAFVNFRYCEREAKPTLSILPVASLS